MSRTQIVPKNGYRRSIFTHFYGIDEISLTGSNTMYI